MKLKIRTIKKASLPSWPLFMLVLLVPTSGHGQAIVATVAAGHAPEAVAINTVTNKIYVANYLGGTVTIIDGATNSTSTVQVGAHPLAIAVNEVTNKIYVAQRGSFPASGGDPGGITVIDGASGASTKVVDPNAFLPRAVAVNSVTNKIYVANFRNITVLDGDTTSTTTVADPNTAGLSPYSLAVNHASNKIYVANNGIDRVNGKPGNVTVIDGATESTTTVTDPNAFSPIAVAVNSATNKIYVANVGNFPGANHGSVTVIDGATNSTTTLVDPNILSPHAVTINEITNRTYVININDSAQDMKGSVTVIDGATNAITTISDPAAISPYAVAVNDKANKIYVVNYGVDPFGSPGTNLPGNVTIIDGATNAVTNLRNPAAINPNAIAVDSITNQIYAANVGSDNLSVIDGGTSTNFALTVAESGSGTGTVTTSPSGIDCPSVCSTVFEPGATVTLTASPASGSTFAGWSGACSGTGPCNVTMSATVSVTATFDTITTSDFSLSLASAQLMVQRGGQSSDAIIIAPLNGSFGRPVQLSCSVSGPPPTPTCAFSAASVTPGANSATSTLTVTVPAATAMWPSPSPQSDKLLYGAWLSLFLVITAIREFKKQQLRHRWAVYGCLTWLLFSLVACGDGNNNNSPVTSQPENYMVTVIGTSGPIQHAAQVRVTAE